MSGKDKQKMIADHEDRPPRATDRALAGLPLWAQDPPRPFPGLIVYDLEDFRWCVTVSSQVLEEYWPWMPTDETGKLVEATCKICTAAPLSVLVGRTVRDRAIRSKPSRPGLAAIRCQVRRFERLLVKALPIRSELGRQDIRCAAQVISVVAAMLRLVPWGELHGDRFDRYLETAEYTCREVHGILLAPSKVVTSLGELGDICAIGGAPVCSQAGGSHGSISHKGNEHGR
jgi:hypothetical protein